MRLLLTVFLLGTITSALAQELVRGEVTDREGQPIVGANVYWKGIESSTGAGTTTDDRGAFRLVWPAGVDSAQLFISHIEYHVYNEWVNSSDVKLRIRLRDAVQVLEEVSITSEVAPSQALPTMEVPAISSRQIAAPFADFTQVLITLPGVQAVSEFSSAYNVRGGNFDENLVYVNGIPVYRPFLVRAGEQEGLSFVNPDLVGGVRFSSGGWAPQYGDKLSSVLDVDYRHADSLAGGFSVGLLGGSAFAQWGSQAAGQSHMVSFRHKRAEYLLGTLEVQGQYFPRFSDFQWASTVRLAEGRGGATELDLLASYGRNRYLTTPQSRETTFGTFNNPILLFVAFDGREVLEYDTWQAGFRLSHPWSSKFSTSLVANYVWTQEREYVNVEGFYRLCDTDLVPNAQGEAGECLRLRGAGTNFDFARNNLEANLATIHNSQRLRLNENHAFQAGVELQLNRIQDGLNEYTFTDSADFVTLGDVVNSQADLEMTQVAAYAQHEWQPVEGHELTYGLRYSYLNLTEESLWSPRLQYVFRPQQRTDLRFKLATGLYQQFPFYREFRNFQGEVNENLRAQKSLHVIAGMEKTTMLWGRPFLLSGEGYYKSLWDVVPYDVDNVRLRYYGENSATAVVYGADFRINGEFIPGAESWFSLSLLSAREDVEGDGLGSLRRPTDRRLGLAAFFQDYLASNNSWRVSLTAYYGTGLPYGPPQQPEFRAQLVSRSYSRFDVALTKVFAFQRAALPDDLWLSLELLNIFANENQISFSWFQDIENRQFAVPNELSQRFVNLKLSTRF